MTEEAAKDTPLAETEAALLPEPERLLLHMPVDIRNVSLVILAILASLFMLHWAKAVFIPVMLGLLFSYALSPVVNWLELKRVPRWLSFPVAGVVAAGGAKVQAGGQNA
jgi:hypothetical protein